MSRTTASNIVWSFKAEINFAEESGVVQVETFGVSLNAEGTCFYGMQVQCVGEWGKHLHTGSKR